MNKVLLGSQSLQIYYIDLHSNPLVPANNRLYLGWLYRVLSIGFNPFGAIDVSLLLHSRAFRILTNLISCQKLNLYELYVLLACHRFIYFIHNYPKVKFHKRVLLLLRTCLKAPAVQGCVISNNREMLIFWSDKLFDKTVLLMTHPCQK